MLPGAVFGCRCSGGLSGGGGCQGCWPRARPCAIARPCGSVRVIDHRVLGCRDAAATRAWVSSGSRRPKVPAWAGVVDQPRRVPMGMMRLRLAGGGADWVGRRGPRRSAGSSGSAQLGADGFLGGPGGDAVRACVAGDGVVDVHAGRPCRRGSRARGRRGRGRPRQRELRFGRPGCRGPAGRPAARVAVRSAKRGRGLIRSRGSRPCRSSVITRAPIPDSGPSAWPWFLIRTARASM